MKRLEGKTALVTGAARGIGAAIAAAFVENGAFVYLTDINDALGEPVAAGLGSQARYLHLDVREERDWQHAMARVLDERGALHVLVNNAGITGFETADHPHDPEHVSLEDWHAVHRTNLDGVFLGCKHGIRAMRRAGCAGSIINLSSRSGLVGIPAAAAYASSKAAIRNHTKTVALYCAEQGLPIRCNSLHPAAILTPMWDPVLGEGPEREARMREFVQDCPMRRFGQPAEVAAVALMLASDEVAYMNGAELNLDGGILAGAVAAPGSR
ncbi:SDR family oxidoreductase [Azovibrio restrictus]|uniref:SDR family oxidoreductase n=1 Tax=Azovibrio restrictus TaxID=146938 RepID=UPI0026EA1DB8|nr:SDR family oxidoreductase [Azovibrio restrictus]